MIDAQNTTPPIRGKLKLFLGAAPGVGKTYEMLEAAQLRKHENVDVVAALVDIHNRLEMTELLSGIEILPKRSFTAQGQIFEEMDLDAVLKRRPALALVDDLAHSNAAGSWHPKRFQDVEQILDAGIDVYTTLNIQHLESLNDVVSQIAGISIRDTVPDSILQKANEIELVDLSPEDLIQRLKQGKVHIPEEEKRSLLEFFTPGNLTALRELALRYTAERVDQQLLNYRQANAISGIWPTRERIIVCISDKPVVPRLVRIAKRSAERRKAPWIALYVETYERKSLSEVRRIRILEALKLAEQLGGEVVTLAGEDPAAEILNYAKSRNVTQIIVGKSERSRLVAAFKSSVTDKLLRQTDNIDILVINSNDNEPKSPPQGEDSKPLTLQKSSRGSWRDYAQALGALALATFVSFIIFLLAPFHNYALIYLTTVMLIAIRQGRLPAIAAALASVPLYDYLFVEPRFSSAFILKSDIITFIIFIVAALIISNLSERVRFQIDATRLSERRSRNLYDFNRKIAGAAALDDVLWAIVHHVASTVSGRALVMMPKDGGLQIVSAYPPEMVLDDTSEAAADWAWRQGKPAGRGSNTLPSSEWLFLPLKTTRGTLGVLGVHIENKARLPSSEEGLLLDTLADQAAVAIERTNLVSDFEETRILMETEKLRSALLSSLSHDLRTPLVSILGAATSLIDFHKTLDEPATLDLYETIREEAQRLNHFVQNLLDMTRLGAGALTLKRDWIEISDVIGAARKTLKRQIAGRKITTEIEPGLPLLFLDFVLIEQVLINLLDNSCKYSPPKSLITIHVSRQEEFVTVRICDQGKGIPESEREKVFDMFYRVKATETQISGTGLGLAICRGIIEAHGGTIHATSTDAASGTCIEFTLPILDVPKLEDIDET